MVKIVIDCLGADLGLEEIIKGVYQASLADNDLTLILVGPEDKIKELLIENGLRKDELDKKFIFVNSEEAIRVDENPLLSLRMKPSSSMARSFAYLKEHEDVEGFVTCGSTAALIVGSILNLNKIAIHGVPCIPCLSCLLPSKTGELFCLVDCGANIDCTKENLVSFAYLGDAFMRTVKGIKNPRIGLISNGSEEGKGNHLMKEVYQELKQSDLNFVGNIEGTKVSEDLIDVLVSDGFSGNIVLKTMEGTAKTIIKDLVKSLKKAKETQDEETVKVLSKTISTLLNKYDFNSLAGATLLGVDKVIVKGHGAANADTIVNTVKQAYVMIRNNYLGSINKN